ncbi:MAG: type II secretion system major pseudopilin GspG [Neisseriaceae bacterium]|jgi:general secretion pathway protein G
MKNNKRKGFTLIEIMVVLVIIGIMAALIVPKVLGRAEDARKVAAKSDISAIMNALKLYNLDNMRYPTNQQGLEALVSKPTVAPIPNSYKDGGYLDKLPTDPWGNAYQYQNPGKHGDVDVYSLGQNGNQGDGENSSSIIGSWQQ